RRPGPAPAGAGQLVLRALPPPRRATRRAVRLAARDRAGRRPRQSGNLRPRIELAELSRSDVRPGRIAEAPEEHLGPLERIEIAAHPRLVEIVAGPDLGVKAVG